MDLPKTPDLSSEILRPAPEPEAAVSESEAPEPEAAVSESEAPEPEAAVSEPEAEGPMDVDSEPEPDQTETAVSANSFIGAGANIRLTTHNGEGEYIVEANWRDSGSDSDDSWGEMDASDKYFAEFGVEPPNNFPR